MLTNINGCIATLDSSWRESKYSRNIKKGMRVIAVVNLNGRTYHKLFEAAKGKRPFVNWQSVAYRYHGTLTKAEWKYGKCMTQVRYTVLCDDGRVRRVQVIHKEY